MRDYRRQREKDKLWRQSLSIELVEKLLPLLLKGKSALRFSIDVGTVHDTQILSITAFSQVTNSTLTIYDFHSDKEIKDKVSLMEDAFDGKVDIEDFSDMKFLKQ